MLVADRIVSSKAGVCEPRGVWWLVAPGFFERVMDGFGGPRLAASLCQEGNQHYSKRLVIEPGRQSKPQIMMRGSVDAWLVPDCGPTSRRQKCRLTTEVAEELRLALAF